MNRHNQMTIPRRVVLQALATCAGATAAGMAPPELAGASPQISDEQHCARYRESEHVQSFYRVNRYPSRGD